MAKVNNLGEDNMKSLVLRLALPSMLAQFVNVLYGIIDRMYIGNLPQVGEVALAGVGVCGPLMTLISSFASLIGIGGSPLLAIRLGEKNQKGAEAILANCFVMLLGLSAALTAFFLALKGPLLMTFGASSVTFPYANSYMTIYTLGTVFAILSVGLNAFIICQGFSALGMLTVVIGAGMNIILDPILMFKLNMGVNGAAVATVLSQATSTLFVLWVLLGKRVPVRITFGGYSLKIMKRVVTFGFSPFIIIATDSILIIALNYVLQKYGGPSQGDMLITCSTVVQSYMQLITMPMGGITGGTQAILSYNYGAKKVDRIRQGEKYILAICVIFYFPNCPPVLCGYFYPGPGIYKNLCLGNKSIYLLYYPFGLPIYLCRWPHCPGHCQGGCLLVLVPQNQLPGPHLAAPRLVWGHRRVFCRACCRFNCRRYLHHGVLPAY